MNFWLLSGGHHHDVAVHQHPVPHHGALRLRRSELAHPCSYYVRRCARQCCKCSLFFIGFQILCFHSMYNLDMILKVYIYTS